MKTSRYIVYFGMLFLILSCESIGVFNHSHDIEGICTRRNCSGGSCSYSCYPDWTEMECLWKEEVNEENDDITYSYFYGLSCGDFCDQETSWSCNILEGSP